MSAVGLTSLMEALVSSAAAAPNTPMDPSKPFSELMSTFAAEGAEQPAAAASPLVDVAVPSPPDAEGAETHAAPEAVAGDPVEAISSSSDPDVGAILEKLQPTPPNIDPAVTPKWEAIPVDGSDVPAAGPPVGLTRSTRTRSRESKTAEIGQLDQPTAQSAGSIQQALAAVAAALATSQDTARPSSRPSGSNVSPEALKTKADTFASLTISRATPKPGQSTPFVPDEQQEADEAGLLSGTVMLTSRGSSFPLDPQLLTSGISHSAQTPSLPHAAFAPVHTAASTSDLDLHQIDALMRDIAAVSGETGRAAFRVTADQLGRIEVRLHTSDSGVAVTIRTHDEQSHATVAQAQQQLTDDMRANGLRVAGTDVMLGGETGRQRQERQTAPAAPIEVAMSETEQSQSTDQQRPDGRYA